MRTSFLNTPAVPKAVRNLCLIVTLMAASVLFLVPLNQASAQDPARVASCSITPPGADGIASLDFETAGSRAYSVDIRRNGWYQFTIDELGETERSVEVVVDPSIVNHFSIRVNGSDYFYCGSVGPLPDIGAPVIERCTVSLSTTDTATLRINVSGLSKGINVRYNGFVVDNIDNSRDFITHTVAVREGVNHFSVQGYNQVAASKYFYCGMVQVGGGPVPPKIEWCNYFLESKPFAIVDYGVPETENSVEIHVWRNGFVIDSFVSGGPFVSQYDLEQVPGTSHISMSTGRVGDEPDRDRRVYCGSTYVDPNG